MCYSAYALCAVCAVAGVGAPDDDVVQKMNDDKHGDKETVRPIDRQERGRMTSCIRLKLGHLMVIDRSEE